MNDMTAKVATICECIDHCFAFEAWCRDFAGCADPDDMVMGINRSHQLVGDATRLLSFLSLRKVDDFFSTSRYRDDDLIAIDLGLSPETISETVEGEGSALTHGERTMINKQIVHLTHRLTLDADSEVDLREIISRSLPLFRRIVADLRACEITDAAKHYLEQTDALIGRMAVAD